MENQSFPFTSERDILKANAIKIVNSTVFRGNALTTILIPQFMETSNHEIRSKRKIKANFFKRILLLFFSLVCINIAFAQTLGDYQSVADGNWNVIGTWERFDGLSWVAAAATPTNADGQITIQAGTTVTVTANVTADQLIVDGSLVVNVGQTLTVNNGTADMAVNGTVTVNGTLTMNAGSVNTVSGTIINSGVVNPIGLTFNAGAIYQHARDGGTIPTATWIAGSSCQITGSILTAPLQLNQAFSTFIWDCPSQSANLTATFAANLSGPMSINNTGGYELILGGNTNLTGNNLNIGAGAILRAGANAITIGAGVFTLNGTILTANVNVNGLIGAAGATIVSTSLPNINANSTINYNAAVNQPNVFLPAGVNFGNLVLSGGGTKTLITNPANVANLTIASGTTLEGGAVNLTATNAFISGTFTDNNAGGAVNLGNVTLTGGSITPAVAPAITIATLTAQSGNCTIGGATNPTNIAGITNINVGAILTTTGAGAKNYNGGILNSGTWNTAGNPNINIQGGLQNDGTMLATGTGIYTFTGAQNISGNQPITFQGNVVMTGAVNNNNSGVNGITVQGTLTGAGTLTNNTTFKYENAVAPTITGFVNAVGSSFYYSAAGAQAMRTMGYGNLFIAGSGIKTAGGAFTASGNLNIAAGTTLADGGNLISVNGNVTNDGTGTGTGGIQITGGLPPHSITGNGSFQRLEINSNTNLTAGSTNSIVNNLILNGANSLTINNNTLTINSTFAGTNLFGGVTSSLVLNGTAAIAVPASITDLNNFTLNNTVGSSISGPLNINGTLTLSQGALTTGANVLSINSSPSVGSGFLTGGATSVLRTFGATNISLDAFLIQTGGTIDLNITSTGGVTSNLPQVDDITIAGGSTLTLGSNLGITGNLTNTGTFTGTGRTMTFNRVGAGNQTISGGINNFGSVIISTSNQVVLASNINVAGNWDLNSGALSGNFEVLFNGVGAQDIGGVLSTTFFRLASSNTALTMSVNQTVTNRLRFTGTGKITIGNSDLTVVSPATITGNDNDSYVVTNGNGRLVRSGAIAAGFVFPVGYSTAAGNYAPVTFPAGSTNVGVRAIGIKHPDNPSVADYLNRYWAINTLAGGNLAAGNFSFTYSSGLVGAPRSAFYYGGAWTSFGGAIASPFTIALPALVANEVIDVSGIDNDPPSIVNITTNLGLVTDLNVGPGSFTITVFYDEDMNTLVNPSIAFPTGGENPAPTLSFNSGVWTDARHYVASYDVADFNLIMNNIDVAVSDGQDLNGILQNPNPQLFANTFSIDMTCLSANAGPDQHVCETLPGGLTANISMNASAPGSGAGTWSYVSGTGFGAFGNINSNTTAVTNVQPGIHTFRWTVAGGACPGFDDVIIFNDQPSTSNAGLPQISCNGNVTLAANNPVLGTGTWSAVPVGAVFTNFNLYNTTVSGLTPGINTLTWTISNAACSSTSSVQITYDFIPVITAGPVQQACTNTFTLAGTDPGPTGTGLWSVVSGGGIFTVASQYNTTVTSVNRGDNIFRWTVTVGGCSDSEDVTISNYSVTANAGFDDYTCDGTYTLQANNPVSQNIVNPPIVATGTWSALPALPPIAFTNVNAYNAVVSNLVADGNTLTWTMTNGFCTATDNVIISNDRPSIPDAGLDDIFCGIDFDENGEGYTEEYNSLLGNAPNLIRGEVGVWTLVAGQGTFVDPTTTPNARVTNLGHYSQLTGPDYWNQNPTINTFRWTITYKNCNLYDEVSIVNAAPMAANAGPDQNVCFDEANLNAIDHGSGAQIHVWTQLSPIPTGGPLDAIIANPDEFNSYVSNLQSLATTFRWTKENTLTFAAKTVTCTIYDDAVINRPPVNLGRPNAGPNQIVCSTQAIMSASPADYGFTITPPQTISGQWSSLLGSGNFATVSDPSTLVTNLGYQTNIFRWTVTYDDGIGGSCISTDDVDITNALPSNANAGPDQFVCTNTALLAADRPTRGNGVWSVIGGSGNITNTTCQSFLCSAFVNNMGTGQNTFLWTMSNSYTDPASLETKTCTLTDQIETWNNAVTAVAGLDQTVCIDNATLSATAPDVSKGESGVWVRTGGSSTVVTPTLFNTTVTGLSPDGNTFRWTLSNAFCSSSDLITITNNNPTDPVASTPLINICSGTAPINGNIPLNGTGLWSVSAGGGVISDPTLASTSVTGIPGGIINTYAWTITKNGCAESAFVSVNNRSVVANAGSDIDNVCGIEPNISTITLAATQPNTIAGESGNWTIVSSSGTILTTSAFDTQVNGMGNGTNTFRWTINNAICSDDDIVDVKVYIPTTSVTNPDFEACAALTDIEVLTANAPDPGRGNGTWTLVSGGGAIANPTSNISNVTNLGYNENRFRWTINHNNCLSVDDIIITNNEVVADAGPDNAICVSNYTLQGNDPTVNDLLGLAQASGQWTVQQGAGVFTDVTAFDSDVSGLSTAVTNILRWTVAKGGCSDFDDVSIVNNEFTVSANVDQTVCDDFAFLNGQQPAGGETGIWTIVGGGGSFVNASLYNTRVNTLSVNPNTFRWTITRANCTAFDDVVITNNKVTANAGLEQRVCINTTILDGNDPLLLFHAGATGNWVATLGGASITDPSSRNTSVTNLAVGQNTFQWTISRTLNGVTCSNLTPALVNIFNDTPSNAVVEADNEACSNSTLLTVLNIPTVGIGVWSNVDNVATFDNSLSFNATVSGLNRGINTFRWTVTNQACTNTDDVIITNNTVVSNAGVDKSTACADFTTLSGNDPTLTQGTGLWVDLSGTTASIVNNTLYNTSITGLEQGTTQFQWTVSLGSCSISDIVGITNNQITATAGVDQITCNDFYGPLDGNDVSGLGGTGVWTSIGPTALVTNSLLFNTGVTGLDPGLNTFRWTVTSGAESCTDFAEVGITNSKVIANAGTDFETCDAIINLGAQDPTPATGFWTQSSGNPVTIVDPTSATSQVTGLTGGVFAFTWTVSNASCSNSATVVVTNSSPQAAIANTGAPQVCNSNGTLVGNALLVGESGLWTPVSASGTIASASNNNTTVTGLGLGNNTFRWTIRKGTNVSCSTFADVTITNNQVIASAGLDQDNCSTSGTLLGNNPLDTQGSGLWTKIGANSAIIADPTLYNSAISNLSDNTSHGFTWTVTLGSCSASDDVNIRNNQVIALAGADAPSCNSTINLDGNDVSSVGASGVWTKLAPSTSLIVNPSIYNTAVNSLEPGVNGFRWTVTSAGACISTDDVEITYNLALANAGLDQETCNPAVNLAALNPAPGTGIWSQIAGNPTTIVDPTNTNTSITGLAGGNYAYRWTVTRNGCSASDDVVITNSTPQTALANTGAPEICDGNGTLVGNVLLVGESGLWTPFSSSGIIAAVSANSTTVSGMGLGNNIFRWTITKGNTITCSSFADVAILNNQVVANAGADQDLCTVTANLQGNNPVSTQGSGLWTKIGANSAIIADPTAYNTSVSNLTDNTSHGFTWTVSLGICSSADDVNIRNNRLLAIAGADQATCNSSFNLDGNDVSSAGATGIWTKQPLSTASFNTPSQYNTTVTSLVPGINRFTWTVTSAGACVSSDDVEITYNLATANAGLDQETCNAFINLAAVNPASGTGSWTQVGGNPATIVDATASNTAITGLVGGNYTFRWTVINNGCSASDDVVVTNSQPQTAIALTGTPEICGGVATLIGNATGLGESGLWTMVDATGTIVNPTSNNTSVSGLKSGTNTFRWTLSKGTSTTCNSFADVSIDNNMVTANAFTSNNISCDATASLTGNDPSAQLATGLWTVSTGATISSSTSFAITATNLAPGDNIFTWTITRGTCSANSSVTITNNQAIAAVGGNLINVCGPTATLNAFDPAPNSGLWTIEAADPGVSIVNPTLYNTSVSNITNSATFRWTVTKETCSNFTTVTVNNNQITLNNGAPQTICANFGTLNAGGALAPGYSGAWTSAGSNPVILSSTTPLTDVTNLDFATNVFFWTVTTPTGCTATARYDIINDSPSTPNAGVDQNLCNSNGALSANNPLYGTGIWSQSGGSPLTVITDPTNSSTTVSNLGTGATTFVWTITKNLCIKSDDVILNNNLFAVATGIDKSVCSDTSSLSIVSGLGGVWTRISGTGILSDSTDPNAKVTNLSFGQNQFLWTVNSGFCTVSDQISITNNSPETPSAEVDKTVCQTNGVAISANNPSYGSGLWTAQGGTATIPNASSNNTIVNNLSNGANTLRWTLTYSGCSKSDDLVITSNAVTATAGNDESICTNLTTLNANTPLVGTGSWSVTSGPAIIANTALANSAVSNLAQGTNILRWTVTNIGCSAFDEVAIINNSPDVANAGADISACSNLVNLIGNNPTIGTGIWTTTSSSAIISNPTLYNTSVTVTPGVTTFTWTITNNGLCPTADDVEVHNNSITVNVNPDAVTCDGTYNLLGTNPALIGTGTGTGLWTVPSGSATLTNPTLFNTGVTGLLSTGSRESILQWTVTDGLCSAFDQVRITNDEVSASSTGFMTCDNNATLVANDPGIINANGLWTVDNQTTQTIALPSSFVTTVGGLVPNAVSRFRWTVSRNSCSATDTVNVEYFVPNANITIPDIAHGCADTIQLIADANLGGGTGVWTLKFGSLQVTIDDNTSSTTVARNLELGNNVFVWTVTNRGCVKSDEVSINNSKPINTAGSDQAACNNAFTMNAQAPTATGTGLWTLISGGVTFEDNALATTNVIANPGTNIVQWTITDNGCSSSKQFRISNNLTNPNAGIDVPNYCQNSIQLAGNTLKPSETGTWSIDGGVVSEVFSSTSVNNPFVSNLRQGNITFVWTISNGTCTAEDRVTVTNNSPTVDAGPDRTICENFVTLAGNNPDPGNTGIWSIGSGTVNIVSPSSYNTDVTNLSKGSNLFTWTINNGICTATDNVLITSNSIDVVAGIPSTEDCADTLYLEATVPPIGASGFWTAVEGGGTFDNQTSYTTIARNLNGFNKLRWTITNGICSFYDEINFTSLLPTIAATQADKSVCSNSTQITANPAIGFGESGIWSKVVGSSGVVIVEPTNFQTQVNNLDPGVNVFRWTISNSQCSTSDLIFITNDEVFADAGQDQVICTDNYSISANVTTGTGVWLSTTPGVIIASSATANSPVSNLVFGNNNFQWVVTYNGCTDVDEVIIRSDLPRNVSAGSDQNICAGSTNLSGTNPGTGSGLWQVTGGAGTFASATSNQTTVSGLSTGSNIFKWTVTVGACSASSQVNVNNNSLYVTAGTNQTICNVNSLQLDGTIPGPGISGTWTVNGGTGTFVDASIYNTTVSNITKGTNTYRWTLTDGSCTNFAEVEVVNNTPDLAIVGADQPICSDNTVINAIAVSNGVGSWSVSSGSATIVNPTSANTVVTGINNGLNTFTWTVTKNGCSLSDDINVTNSAVNAFIANDNIVVCNPAHTTVIIGNAVGTGETGFWTKISAGPGDITNSTSNVTTVTNLGNGDTFFRWTVANGLCSNSDDLKITDNYYNTTANAAGPTTICVDYSPILGGSLPVGATGLWTSTAADVTFDNPSLVATIARNLPGGTSAITWTVTKDGCSSPASVSLLNNAIYTSAGSNQIVCNPSTTLNAQKLLGTETGFWTVNNALVVIANSTDPGTAVSNLITGDNTFTWTLNGNGCSVSQNVIVSNNAFTVSAGSDNISCGPSFGLAASDPLSGTGLWTVSSGTGNFASNSSFGTTVSGMNNGPNSFVWSVNRNGCNASDTVIITNDLYLANAGADRAICSNQTTVSAQPLNPTWGASGSWTALTGGGVFTTPTAASTLVTGLSTGDNRLRWTVTKGFCVSSSEIVITNNSVTATAGTDETTCNNFTTLSATPLNPGATGFWTKGGFSAIIANTASPTTAVTNLQQGVNTFAWTVTDKGCTGTSTVRVTSNFFLAKAGNDQNLTVDFTNMEAKLPTVTATGTWSVFAGNGAFANINDPSSAVTNLGFGFNTFRWTVLYNSCTAFDDVNIIFNAITADAGPNQVICTDRAFMNAVDASPGIGTWSILSGGGTFSNPLSQTSEVTGILPGSVNIYRWTVVLNGYTEYDDVTIINSEFNINAGIDQNSCVNSTTLAAEPAGTGSGVWSVLAGAGNFANPSLHNTVVTNLADGPNIFVWTVVKSSGCFDSDSLLVTYNTPPTADFITSTAGGCSPVDVLIQNNSSSGTFYLWDYGNGSQATHTTLIDTTITYIAPSDSKDSTYLITLVAFDSKGCSDTVARSVTAFRIPKVDFDANPHLQPWPNNTVYFDNFSGSGYPNYYWDFGDGTNRTDNILISNFPHSYTTWGVYPVSLTVNSATCNSTLRDTIEIVPPLPRNAGGRNYAGCDPYALNFVNATEYADRWYWDLGDGSYSYDMEPSVIYDIPGQYIVSLYAWGPGSLVDSVFIRFDTVNVYPTPVADFLVEPDTVMLPNQAVYCYNRSINGDLYEWSFGDNGNEVFIEENPIHYYTKPGTYNITLRVYTQTDPSCFNSKTINAAIVVEDAGVCKFPNAFSPNPAGPSNGQWLDTDVSNDIFHPVHRGIHEYKLEIFNRWGEKIFESKNPAIGWDGYREGKLLPQDVYVWKVTGKYRNGVIFKNAGDVTLIR